MDYCAALIDQDTATVTDSVSSPCATGVGVAAAIGAASVLTRNIGVGVLQVAQPGPAVNETISAASFDSIRRNSEWRGAEAIRRCALEAGVIRLPARCTLSIVRAANDGNRAAVRWSRHVTHHAKLHSADLARIRRSRCRAPLIQDTVCEPR